MKHLVAVSLAAALSASASNLLANSLPVLTLNDRATQTGKLIEFVVSPIDADGVVPGVYLSAAPADAELRDNGNGTRTFRWHPNLPGEFNISFAVSDAQDSSMIVTSTMVITVTGSPVEPQLLVGGDNAVVQADEVSNVSEPIQITSISDSPDTQSNDGVQLSDSTSEAVIGSEFPVFAKRYAELVATADVVRISDLSNFGNGTTDISHQYSKRRVWNSDESMLELENSIIDANTFKVVVGSVPLTKERAWSHSNPNKMFGIKYSGSKPNQLASYDLSSGETENIYHFSQFSTCSFGDWEGDISRDDRYVLVTCRHSSEGDAVALSVDMQTRQIIGQLELESDFNWGGFSLSGDYIIIEYAQSWSTSHRSIRYSSKLSEPMLLANHVYHGDFGLDSTGADIYALISDEGVHYYQLSDGSRINVGGSSEGLAVGNGHISCRSTQRLGWCFVSSIESGKMGMVRLGIDQDKAVKRQSNGRPLYSGVEQFELWGLSRSSSSHYLATPRASLSPSGKMAVFASDWFGQSNVHTFLLEKVN